MQIADVSRLSRVVAGCAGVAVAAFGALPLLTITDAVRPQAALLPAGLALLLAALPGSAPAVRLPAYALAALAAVLGVVIIPSDPAAGLAVLLTALVVLALVGYLVRLLEGADRQQRELVAELHGRTEFAAMLLQSMNEAVMVLDVNYRVLDVNRRWHELAGHRAEDVVGSRPAALPPPGAGDWLVRHSDGTDVPVLATMAAVPDPDGRPRAYVATYADITDHKRAEEELSEHAAELTAGNDRLREANARLESALAFKNDLTSMLTHDMAQPISSIASLAELLSDDWADFSEDFRRELATKINKNTRRLIKMMNDLQLLLMLDTGSVTARRTPVPVREVVESVVATAPPDTVSVEMSDGLSALADRGHLTAVVQNLLSNALAYAEAPVHIRARQEADTVVLVVQDSGAGIPEELLPTLFDRFMRGAGLGLFIVRHLVEANGGSVRYERADPHGARLIVTLESASLPG